MWTRAELKESAKAAFKRNFWSCVLVAFVLGLLVNGGGSSPAINFTYNTDISSLFQDDYSDIDSYLDDEYYYYNDGYYYDDDYYYYDEDITDDVSSTAMGVGFVLVSVIIVIAIIVLIVGLALRIFVFAPIEVGGCRFFVENSFEKSSAGLLFYSFNSGHYKNIIGTMFFRDLYTFLWTLLFIIPGIVKSYEYRMVPYLLADCPDMPREDAFSISRELMTGNKWKAFVLDLSFIGWNILNGFTCGILGIFWVNPYVQATNAELFLNLKKNYFSGQYVSQGAEF